MNLFISVLAACLVCFLSFCAILVAGGETKKPGPAQDALVFFFLCAVGVFSLLVGAGVFKFLSWAAP